MYNQDYKIKNNCLFNYNILQSYMSNFFQKFVLYGIELVRNILTNKIRSKILLQNE